MADNFLTVPQDRDDPGESASVVVPSDTTLFTTLPRALFVGTGGNLSLLGEDGTSTTWKNVPSGAIIPFRASRVNSTLTTATDILAIY